jgi:endonuclease YncB( thermonuclease family)
MQQRRWLRLAILLLVALAAHFVFRGESRAPASGAATRDAAPHERAPAASAHAAPRLGPCDVTHVTDGDTLDVRCAGREERVRMLQIDTPERDDPLYEEARDALEALVAGRGVELQLGPEERDDYGRLLAYVFANGANLNLAMIERGWSPYFDRYGAGAYPREFARAERAAREARLGIWGLER